MLIFSVIAVLVATGLALGAVASYRRRQLGRRVHLELANLGNVQTCYELRAEDPEDALKFRFLFQGSRLAPRQTPRAAQVTSPRPADRPLPQEAHKKQGGILAAADGVMGSGGAVAGFLGTVGLMLPRSLGAPLLRASSQLRGKQIAVARVRSAPVQVRRLNRLVPRQLWGAARRVPAATASRPAPAAQVDASPWVQTPAILPGDTLSIELLVQSGVSGPNGRRPFRVISRPVEQEAAPVVIEEASVLFGAGFWTRPFLPYLSICFAAAALLLLAFWLASTGVLAW
jgi:hypothetical protein